MKRLALLLFLLVAHLCAAQTLVPTFTMTHTLNDEHLVFSFPSGDTDKYYTNAAVAVIIEEMYVDGVPVTALSYKGNVRPDVDTRTYEPVLPSRMIYRLHNQQLITAKSRDKKGQLEYIQYDLPKDAAKIEFTYRIRYPNARLSQEMHLVSFANTETLRLDKKPE